MNEQPRAPKRFHLFAQAAIPPGLTLMVTSLILTQAAALLMNQPAAYWLDPAQATNVPFGFLLPAGPLPHLVLFLVYAAVAALLLGRLPLAAGYPLAAGLVFMHAAGLARVTTCGFTPLYQPRTAAGCNAYGYALFIAPALAFVLTLLGLRLPERLRGTGKRILVAFLSLWLLLMGYGVARAAFPPASPWEPLAPAHSPGPRSMAAVAYDTQRQRAVLFGGLTVWNGEQWVYDNSTWEWDGEDWEQIDTPVAPAGRILHAMAYDEEHGKIVLYGGQNENGILADLWEWDGQNWHRLCPVCNPAARYGHKMVFDTTRREIVLYGGRDEEVGFGEGWTWNGESWTYFSFENSAPGLYFDPLIYDSANQRAVSVMGNTWGGTWVWSGSDWNKLSLAVQPPVRAESVLVYDPVQEYCLMFGGRDEEVYFNDTWLFDGETWTRVDTPTAPARRTTAVGFYDPVRKSILLYGGTKATAYYSDSNYSDMWEFHLPKGDRP